MPAGAVSYTIPPLFCLYRSVAVLFGFLLLLPTGKFPLAFFTFVIGQNVWKETSGNRLKFVVRDFGVIGYLFPPGHRSAPLM